jgi:hypothetical protein
MTQKLSLLAEMNVLRRAELLLQHLSETVAQSASAQDAALCFPPEFSVN